MNSGPDGPMPMGSQDIPPVMNGEMDGMPKSSPASNPPGGPGGPGTPREDNGSMTPQMFPPYAENVSTLRCHLNNCPHVLFSLSWHVAPYCFPSSCFKNRKHVPQGSVLGTYLRWSCSVFDNNKKQTYFKQILMWHLLQRWHLLCFEKEEKPRRKHPITDQLDLNRINAIMG